MNEKLLKVLILLILYRIPTRANVYDLTRILEWRFGCFDNWGIIDQLEEEDHLNIHRKQVSDYFITQKGIEFLRQEMPWFKKKIFNEFPSETEFLLALTKE